MRFMIHLFFIATAAFATTGCEDETPVEEAAEEVGLRDESPAEEVGEELEEAGEEIEENVEEAGEEVEEAFEE